MTEDERWGQLRSALLTGVRPPALDGIGERVRRRRAQRGRTVAGLAVVVVVVALIPVLAARTPRPVHPDPSGGTGPVPTSGSGPASVSGSTTSAAPIVSTAWSVGADGSGGGFALVRRCRAETDCALALTGFRAGGAAVARRAVPVPFSTADSYDLEVLGPDRAVVRRLPDSGPATAVLTTDGGRTWRSAPTSPSGSITRLPDGTVLENACVDGFGECAGGPTVRLPDGGLTSLATVPAVDVRSLDQGPDGSWWLWATSTVADGTPLLYRSTDGGQHWTPSRLATVGQPIFAVQVAQVGGTWFAAVIGELPQVKNGLLALDRSTDGGRTWTRVWRARASTEPRTSAGVPLARSGTAVDIVTELGVCYSSADAGRTFARTTACATGWTTYARGTYLRTTDDGRVEVSTDATTWRSIPF